MLSASSESLILLICHGDRGEIRKAYRQEQEEQLGALGLTLNAIALWNSTYIQAAIDQLTLEGWDISQPDIARVSPLLLAQGRHHALARLAVDPMAFHHLKIFEPTRSLGRRWRKTFRWPTPAADRP